MTGSVLKTDVAEYLGQAGSIPVRLRQRRPFSGLSLGTTLQDRRRVTPRTDAVLSDPQLSAAADRLGTASVKRIVVETLARCRAGEIAPDDVVSVAVSALPKTASGLRRVINATGVIVHTNLGRAPLSAAAVEALVIAAGTTNVELNLASGRRDQRGRSVLAALSEAVPAAGGVHIVNNGAASLALAACALAAGREIVIARGEMVEIGDGFRIPELLESVGARLREVGSTNRVRLADYANVITDQTAFILKVHPSNFEVTGFTSSVGARDLARLSVPLVVDIGSGLLAPHPRLPEEPSAATALAQGADLVTASGDKLLGGPQCGLLFGTAELIETLRRHPFARALRVDKLTLAALEATISGPDTPVGLALAATPSALMARAERVALRVGGAAVPSLAVVGGGGAPGVSLPSAAVALPSALAALMRLDPELPVIGHVEKGRLLLDLATVPPADDDALAAVVRRAFEAAT